MSNYPPPYPGPPAYPSPYAGPPGGQYLPPPPPPSGSSPSGQRAALLMFITGALLLLLGACDTIQAAVVPTSQLEAQMRQQQAAMGNAGGYTFSPETMRTVSVVFGVLFLAVGGTLIALALGVRRQRRGPIIAGLILSIAIAAVAGLLLLAFAIMGLQAPVVLAFACLMVIPTALAGLQTAWLIAALRHGPGVDPYQQYLAQYYYHQQVAQSYAAGQPQPGYGQPQPGYGQGGGYGYGMTPPPAPPPQLPPSDQAGV